MSTILKKGVAVFKSRSQVMSFVENMNSLGAECRLISTPKEAHLGCGVSAEFSLSQFALAKAIVGKIRYNSFYGFFLIEKRGSRTTTVRI